MIVSVQRLLIALAAVTALLARYNATLPLSGDEAYYWVWSHLLQAGYHDHPPAIAVLVKLTTSLLGDTIFAVRLVAALAMSGALIFIWRMTRQVYDEQTARWAVGIAFLLPMTQMGYVLATPDAPLVLFWAGGAAFGLQAVTGPGRWRDFLLAGVFSGLAMTSKYTGVLLPFAVFVFVLLRRRDLLRSPRLWGAVAVAAVVFSPVLWWNYDHGFESFAFQYQHGSGKQSAVLWPEFGEFLAGQLAVLSPVLCGLLIWVLCRPVHWRQNDRRFYLAVLFLVPMALFLYKALFTKIQLNWSAPAYLTAIPLLAGWVVEKRLIRTAGAGLALAVLMAVVLRWPSQIGLPPKMNIHNRLFGGEQAAAAVMDARQPGDTLFSDHLTRAALLQFYVPDHARVMIPTETRFSEYTRWDQGTDWSRLHGVYLSKDEHLDELTRLFGRAELLQVFVAFKPGFRDEKYYIYRVGTTD